MKNGSKNPETSRGSARRSHGKGRRKTAPGRSGEGNPVPGFRGKRHEIGSAHAPARCQPHGRQQQRPMRNGAAMQAEDDQTHQCQVALGRVVNERVVPGQREIPGRECGSAPAVAGIQISDCDLQSPLVTRKYVSRFTATLLPIPGQRFGNPALSVCTRETGFLSQPGRVAHPARRAQLAYFCRLNTSACGSARKGFPANSTAAITPRRQRQWQRPGLHLSGDFASHRACGRDFARSDVKGLPRRRVRQAGRDRLRQVFGENQTQCLPATAEARENVRFDCFEQRQERLVARPYAAGGRRITYSVLHAPCNSCSPASLLRPYSETGWEGRLHARAGLAMPVRPQPDWKGGRAAESALAGG